MQITVIATQGVIFESAAVDSVSVSTESGYVTILEDHVPLISILKPGELQIKEGENIAEFALSTGLLRVKRGSIVEILADSVERPEDIDLQAAEEAIADAERYLAEKNDADDIDYVKLQQLIERETARIKFKSSRKPQLQQNSRG